MVKIYPITKIEFSGSFNKTFYDVPFYFTVDPVNCATSEWQGGIKICNKQLYINGVYIPIHESLVGYAYGEFVKIVRPNYKYIYIYFKILPGGKFIIRYDRYNNTACLVLNKLNDVGTLKKWVCPYWDEELSVKYPN